MFFIKKLAVFTIIFFILGCSQKEGLDHKLQFPKLPQKYNEELESIKIDEKWLYSFEDKQLLEIIKDALINNYDLKKLYYDIKIKEQELKAADSLFYPSSDLSLDASKETEVKSSDSDTSASLSLNLTYDLDIWGKLSDSYKSANMNLLETKALYEEAKQQLIADACILYFQIIEANNLLALYEKNLKTLEDNYKLIYSRYTQGLSTALDLLDTKNSIFTQKVSINSIETTKYQLIYQLEQLLGTYPKGKLDIKKDIPLAKKNIAVGIPSDIILKKPSIVASWNALLSKDHLLAFTHKQRLPSLSIGASIDESSSSALSWSLLGGLTAPIFYAGQLKANEEIAYLELKQAELTYLNTIYSSFVDIETLIQEAKKLYSRFNILKQSTLNANKSLKLSLNQYLKGLVEYTTVLEQQETFYNTQASLIEVKMLILENKINLHKALGGDTFIEKEVIEKEELNNL